MMKAPSLKAPSWLLCFEAQQMDYKACRQAEELGMRG